MRAHTRERPAPVGRPSLQSVSTNRNTEERTAEVKILELLASDGLHLATQHRVLTRVQRLLENRMDREDNERMAWRMSQHEVDREVALAAIADARCALEETPAPEGCSNRPPPPPMPKRAVS